MVYGPWVALATLAICAPVSVAAPAAFSSSRSSPDRGSHDLGWDLSQTPLEWFEQNRADILEQRSLRLADASPDLEKRNWNPPTGGLPPLPLTYWLISNTSSLPTLANAAVRRMQTWFFDDTNRYNGTSWWQQPVIVNSYIDLDRATGQTTNEHVVRAILDNNSRGQTYMIDKYVDDQAWWGLTLAKAYQQYGDATYLGAAKAIQAADTSNITSSCGGGVVWLTYKPSIKNTVTNALHIALSAKLYRITGTAAYLETAKEVLNWWLGWAYQSSTGAVYDTITSPSCEPENLNLYTYNAGIILGGLADLYATTNNQTYITIANKIAYQAIAHFSNGKGIMRESCEHDGPPNDDDSGGITSADGAPVNNLPAGCQNDNIMFKAIFAQNLGYLYAVTNDTQISNYLTINAFSAAYYDMDDTFLFSEWWDGPFNKTLANVLTQGNAIGLLSAAVSVNTARAAAVAEAAGLPAPVITNSYTVYLPLGGQSVEDSTAVRRRWTPPRQTLSPRP